MLSRSVAGVIFAALIALPASAGAPPARPGGGLLEIILMPLAMILIFYFLLFRPQQKRQKDHKAMIDSLKPRDVVVTQGGLVGKVTKVEDNEVTVELADNVRVRVLKGFILENRTKATPAAAANDAS